MFSGIGSGGLDEYVTFIHRVILTLLLYVYLLTLSFKCHTLQKDLKYNKDEPSELYVMKSTP